MARTILSASINAQPKGPVVTIKPAPGINILSGQNAAATFWGLSGVVDIYPTEQLPTSVNAEISWSDGVIYGVTSRECNGKTQMVADYVKSIGSEDPRYLVKRLYKQRLRDIRDNCSLFNGLHLDNPRMQGESTAILEAFHSFIEKVPVQKNGRPLFLCNFLERLDGSADPLPLFEELAALGRQAFILLPEGCTIEHMKKAVRTVKI